MNLNEGYREEETKCIMMRQGYEGQKLKQTKGHNDREEMIIEKERREINGVMNCGEITQESRAEYSEIRNFRKGCMSHSPRRICYTIEVREISSPQQI